MTWNKKQLFCIKPHGIIRRILCIVMVVWFACSAVVMDYQEAKAAEFTAGAIAAGESLEWISTILASTGLAISVKELFKPRQADIEKDIGKNIDWDNVDWGDMLDSPAAQDQIKDAEDMINRLYGNASAKWKEMYEKSLSPTPTPDNPEPSPPVTVAPIDPDTVTPPDWDILKKTSMNNGYLALGAATYWCLKETVSNWWDKLINDTAPTTDLKGNPFGKNIKDLVGKVSLDYTATSPNSGSFHSEYYIYNISTTMPEYAGFDVGLSSVSDGIQNMTLYSCGIVDGKHDYSGSKDFYVSYYVYNSGSRGVSDYISGDTWNVSVGCSSIAGIKSSKYSYQFYIPYLLNGNLQSPSIKPIDKSTLWVNPSLKNDYDGNKSPSIPDSSPAPAIKIPSLDEIKDLQKKGNDSDDENRPSIIQEFVTNHYTNPTPAPEPTTAPDPDPNPTTAPNPDPNPSESPDPTTTPAVNPEISVAPKPSSAPQPSGTPENPDDETIPDNYKPDLRLVFPFCIPFDLIHLLNVFDAEPVAPVFSFPFDLSLKNPFKKGEMILDVHETFEFDFSNLDSVIEIFRITETIGFVIGLMVITRNLIRG